VDVLTAILACSLHVDDDLVRALVSVQTNEHPFFVGDLTKVTQFESAKTLDSARAALQVVREAGHSPALGLLAVPAAWADEFGKPAESLWDACTNIQIGTAKLSDFDHQCRAGKGRRRTLRSSANRACIVSRYAAALSVNGRELLGEVFAWLSAHPPDTQK
jgi:hypothetical protein